MDIRTLFSQIFILTEMIHASTTIVIKDVTGKVHHNGTWLCKEFWDCDDLIAISFHINLVTNTLSVLTEQPQWEDD